MPKKVYLQPMELVKKSRHHTSYAGDGVVEGQPSVLHKMEFVNGVARNVEEQMFRRFKDLGHCATAKPKMPGDDDDE